MEATAKSSFKMQMHFISHYSILITIINGISCNFAYNSTEQDEFCPTFCTCDFYDGLNRANCSSQRLIAPNVELSSEVEILDLSYNAVAILDNSCFEGLLYLQHLNLSHNSVHTIYLDAFSSLRSLTLIDLSHNRLEYLDERILQANLKLKSLSLAANKFMSLQNKPLLRSFSLRFLNLRSSHLTYLYEEVFLALPSLRELDLSGNLMITLNVAAFVPLLNLKYVNLSENRWHCDRGLLNPIEVLKQRGTKIELSECPVTADDVEHSVMFERMTLREASESNGLHASQPPEPRVTRTRIANVWRRPSVVDHEAEESGAPQDSEELQDTSSFHPSCTKECAASWHRLCHKYRPCQHNISDIRQQGIVGSKTAFTVNDLYFVFLLGVSLGIIFVVCIISCTLCIRCCCEMRKRPHDYQMVGITVTPDAMLPQQRIPQADTLNTAPQSFQLQYQQRISRRRAARRATPGHNTTAVVRRDCTAAQGRDNFLSRLFGRPARHQYYRSINHNTATLIRRLSRSNLFSNRSSHHFAEENNSSRQQQPQPQQNQHAPRESSASSLHQTSEELYVEPLSLRTEAVEISCEHRVNPGNRPETPPPSYREVVINVRK